MWIDRSAHSAHLWLIRRSLATKLVLGAVLFSSPCWCGCGGLIVRGQYLRWFVYTAEDREFFRRERDQYPENGGVPSIARRLKAEMKPIPDPDTALRLHPDWAAVRFKNGEWVFGRGINSHWIAAGRGTLVLKDSRGRIRIFFGHVCGSNPGLGPYGSQHIATLDDFYKEWWLAENGMLREWIPPP